MSITRPNTLIPYFMAYLIHYFYNLKTKRDRKILDFRIRFKKTNKRRKTIFFIVNKVKFAKQ